MTQLDLENTALTKAAHHNNESMMSMYDTIDSDNIHSIAEQIRRLKAQLKIANEKSTRPAENIEGKM